MRYPNHYKPKPEDNSITKENDNRDTDESEYDWNFLYAVTKLVTDRLELRPFLPKYHAKPLLEAYRNNPSLAEFDFGFEDEDSIFGLFERVRRNPNKIAWAIFSAPPHENAITTSADNYELAGYCGYRVMDEDNLVGEMGIVIAPAFQRSHVATHAIGLMLQRLLDLPIANGEEKVSEEAGFGYRRAKWGANTLNEKSIKTAKRMGFKFEGITRNVVIVKDGVKWESAGRPGDLKENDKSTSGWVGSITWQDWENGGRELVLKQMARTS